MSPDDLTNAKRLDFANCLSLSQTADSVVKELRRAYALFLRSINPDEDVAFRVSCFGSTLILVEEFLAVSPALLLIFGTDASGAPVRLLQHVSQTNVMMSAIKRSPPDAPRRTAGFKFSWELPDEY